MRHVKKIAAVAVLAGAVSLWWARAQPAPQPLDALLPAGPLIYLEARDLGALLRDWDTSGEKRTWLAGSNYGVFSRSHLALRLTEAQSEFATAAGLPADYALLNSVAGTQSVLALYDIGKLEFLYITRLPSARVLASALWRARATYQTRRAGNVDYYVKTDRASQRTAAIAYVGDLLLVATRETALSGALELIARVNRPALAAEPWYAQSVAAAQPGTRDVRLVYNLERLVATPHFRSYWVQRNTAELREFSSGLADLERAAGEVRERRVMLRQNASANRAQAEAGAARLLAMVPDNANFYRAWAEPASQHAERLIGERLFAQGSSGVVRQNDAPELPENNIPGDEGDLEVRIDEAAAAEPGTPQLARLRNVLAGMTLDAMLEVSTTTLDADQVFVRPASAFVIESSQPWNADAARQAFAEAAGKLWTQGTLGVEWRASNRAAPAQELTGLGTLLLAVDGNRLIVGSSPELVAALWARRAQTGTAGAVYAAGWRHARELPNFERMMRLIDYPEIRAQQPAEGAPAREPMFYSENLASLGRTFVRVDQASIAVHDSGDRLQETVLYRLLP